MIPCQEDDKHLKSRMFKVTVTSKNLTRGVKSRGILLTMNRLLLKIHLYKNELIREGAQIKRILQKHAGLAIWPGMWLKAHISVTYNIFVMTVIGMFYCIPKAEATFHVETKDIKGINFSSVAVELLGVLPECRGEALEKHAAKRSHSAAPLSTQPLLLLKLTGRGLSAIWGLF